MVYTKEQIKKGEGFFSSGEWTCVWRIGKDQYITAAKDEYPRNPNAELVAGGRLSTKTGKVSQLLWD